MKSRVYLICETCDQVYSLPCNPRENFPVAQSANCEDCGELLKVAKHDNGIIRVLDLEDYE